MNLATFKELRAAELEETEKTKTSVARWESGTLTSSLPFLACLDVVTQAARGAVLEGRNQHRGGPFLGACSGNTLLVGRPQQ